MSGTRKPGPLRLDRVRYAVKFGRSVRWFYTRYHAEQLQHALRLNGTPSMILVIDADGREHTA